MSLNPGRTYRCRYGYSWGRAISTEFWWRLEHLFPYRGEDGGLCGYVARYAYRRRHESERRAAA